MMAKSCSSGQHARHYLDVPDDGRIMLLRPTRSPTPSLIWGVLPSMHSQEVTTAYRKSQPNIPAQGNHRRDDGNQHGTCHLRHAVPLHPPVETDAPREDPSSHCWRYRAPPPKRASRTPHPETSRAPCLSTVSRTPTAAADIEPWFRRMTTQWRGVPAPPPASLNTVAEWHSCMVAAWLSRRWT